VGSRGLFQKRACAPAWLPQEVAYGPLDLVPGLISRKPKMAQLRLIVDSAMDRVLSISTCKVFQPSLTAHQGVTVITGWPPRRKQCTTKHHDISTCKEKREWSGVRMLHITNHICVPRESRTVAVVEQLDQAPHWQTSPCNNCIVPNAVRRSSPEAQKLKPTGGSIGDMGHVRRWFWLW
jgi:hypothetical protein